MGDKQIPVGQVGGGSGVVPAYTDHTLVRCTYQYKTHKPPTCRSPKWQVGRSLGFLNTAHCLPCPAGGPPSLLNSRPTCPTIFIELPHKICVMRENFLGHGLHG